MLSVMLMLIAGFLQVRENWKRSGNLGGQGKSGKMLKIWHSQGKVRENENCIQKTHQNSSFHHVKLENFLGGDTPEPPLGSWGCILTFTVISGPLLCKFLASPLHHWWVVVTNSCLSVKGDQHVLIHRLRCVISEHKENQISHQPDT